MGNFKSPSFAEDEEGGRHFNFQNIKFEKIFHVIWYWSFCGAAALSGVDA